MHINFARVCFLVNIFYLALLGFPAISMAEDVVYDGSNPSMLRVIPGLTLTPALYPNSLSGNTVTITSALGGAFGGVTLGNDNVANNTLKYLTNSPGAVLYGGYSQGGNAVNNTVITNGGTIDLYGGWSTYKNAIGNTVILDGGATHLLVVGGYSDSGNSYGNTATVINASVNNFIYGGQSVSGNASENTVNILGGSVLNAAGGATDNGSASQNVVNLRGGSVSSIFAGDVDISGNATNNTVNLYGGTVTTDVWGGRSASGNAFTGNTLNVLNQFTFSGLHNFEFFTFNLPSGFQTNSSMLSVATADFGGASTVKSINVAQGTNYSVGDTVILINSTGAISGTLASNKAHGLQGVALVYDWDVNLAANTLTATLAGVAANPQMKGLSQGNLASMALINEGGDLIAGQGISSAIEATCNNPNAEDICTGLVGFSALSAGYSRYETGSHVDMRSFSLLAGLAWGQKLDFGHLTAGMFFEVGSGSYDTYSSFSTATSVEGGGNTHYLGGGVLARTDFTPFGPGHFYLEGSARTGGVYNRYTTSDLRDAWGKSAGGYDTYAPYYGLHGGGGYMWNLSDALTIDVYGKYFWTRQEGNSVTLDTGDHVKFENINSSRLRLGNRLTYALNEYVSPFVGIAYEHEFDGKAEASTYGYAIKSPTLRGDTGIGELGFSLRPSQSVPLSLDLGVQGYVGRREGMTGSFQLKFEF